MSAFVLTGCLKKNPLYCEDNSWCTDPARPYCDVDGSSKAAAGTAHTCVDKLTTPNCVPTGDELCNGEDDDCDGQVDEDLGLGEACSVGVGACAVSGKNVCGPDGEVTCDATPGSAVAERCDGIDNDCDGKIDENWDTLGDTCTAGIGACEASGVIACMADGEGTACNATPGTPATTEICGNQIDETCDGSLVDGCDCDPQNSTPQDCGPSTDTGACTFGTQTCLPDGSWGACQDAVYPTTETCNGKDDDCDGKTDEGFGVSGSCTVGVGECVSHGQLVCSADGTGTQCDATPGDSVAERCDGLDNDCDGKVDEDWPTLGSVCSAGVGACAASGHVSCTASGLSAACDAVPGTPAATDTCGNDIDENCDGSLTDGCDCTPGSEESCGPDTETGICMFGTRVCQTNGTWGSCVGATYPGTETCNSADDDCNGTVDDGFGVGISCTSGVGACQRTGKLVCTSDGTGSVCNAMPGSPKLETCNGVDDDCNGSVDDGIAPSCMDSDVLVYCGTNGAPVELSCADKDQTCYHDACAGVCASGTYRCSAAGDSQRCDFTGAWKADTTCDAPKEICDVGSGQCVANPVVVVGQGSASGGATLSAFNEDFLATPVVVSDDVVLRELGVLTTASSLGGKVILALYSDKVDSGVHKPDALITYTSELSLAQNAANTKAPLTAGVKLTAGTRYWVAVKVLVNSGDKVQFYQFSSTQSWARSGAAWGPPPPNTFPSVFMNAGKELGIYLRVQHYWH